jgi:hypothetical protein
MVASDHDDPDPRSVSVSNGYRGLRTRRIDDPHGPDVEKVVLHGLRRLHVFTLGNQTVGHRQSP